MMLASIEIVLMWIPRNIKDIVGPSTFDGFIGAFILLLNEFIDPSAFSLSYCSVDDAYAFINQLGPRTLLSKIDLKGVLRLIPVRQADWNLLVTHWKQ